MKKGYCPIDDMVYTNNFPGRCALPAETFLIFKRNLWFVENVMRLLCKCVHWFSFFNGLWKRAIAISTARYIRTTFPAGVHFRRKHFSYLKENLLDRPYGPQGPWAQPLFDCVAVPSGGFFSGKTASRKQIMRIYGKIRMFVDFCYFGQCWPKFEA